MAAPERPYQPSTPWRLTSALTFGTVGFLCRSFLYALNRTETTGLEQFLEVLDSRMDETKRSRGLLTVSNHVSVLDDPLIWGVLPHRYFWSPNNMRFGLGSHDICFKNGVSSSFFSYGNTLPTHRMAHSKFGGLFQPTMTQCIRLLSDPHTNSTVADQQHNMDLDHSLSPFARSDPFSESALTYSTNGTDSFPAPSAYPSRRYSWVHIFPEGMIHQHPDKVMRYFKWGVARLILEAEPCPDVLPMWIDGPQFVMDNERLWPRPLPRIGKEIKINFGDLVDSETVFGPFRDKWRILKERTKRKRLQYSKDETSNSENDQLGILTDEELKYGKEAEQLRIEVTLAIRNEVLKVRRRASSLPDEDPKRSLAETFRQEKPAPREGTQQDGSSIRDT